MQSSDSSQFRHHLAAGDLHLLVINLGGKFQRADVMTPAINIIQIEVGLGKSHIQFLTALIGKCHHGIDGQTTQLCQQHARQCHAIIHLGQIDVGLVQLYVNGELVGTGGDTFTDHRLDVIVKFLYQFDVAAGKLLLSAQRNDLPVGCINIIDDVLYLTLTHLVGELLGKIGNLVHRGDFASHVDRLGHRQGTAHQVMDVVGHATLGQQGYRRGDILTILKLQRSTRARVNDQIIVVAAGLQIEGLGGQHLILLDERDLT